MPHMGALRLFARVAVRDRPTGDTACQLEAQHVGGTPIDLRGDDRCRELIGWSSGPGLYQRNRHLSRELLAVFPAVPLGGVGSWTSPPAAGEPGPERTEKKAR